MNCTSYSLRFGSLLALVTLLALAPPGDDAVRPMPSLGLARTASTLRADEPTRRGPLAPKIAPESGQAERAMGGFRVPEGMRVSLFAAEPLMANPVAFCFDERGRVYVCETFRQSRGVTDNRSHDQKWLLADLAAQTVEDRIRYHRELLGEKANEFELHDDRIRLLEDTTGDGRADRSVVFADGFHQLEEGTGAGVLAYRGDIYFTNIPRLWRLRDTTGDDRADVREALHDGYGVRVAFRGHDLHGLIMGPDGRLYFSIGDRGYHIELEDRTLADPESGAVFRCELDGSHLEIFATGLRNPQELAFDEFGNLFTGDNNSDSGDRARWVYVVEGGDSGWRMAYQYLPDRGPFNRERLWHPFHAGQPAYIVPPVANLGDGPSGLAYYPGVGLDDRFQGKFFLCDFRGGPANSGIRTFRVQPQGAFFELIDQEETIWHILATDVAFAPDGSLFLSDWVDGWEGEGKGRLYRFSLENSTDPRIEEVKSLLASEWKEHSEQRLVDLLSHADQRIRQEAQFELVRRQSAATLALVAREADNLLARLHAIWGTEQLCRQARDLVSVRVPALTLLEELLEDSEPEVRSQSARMLGEMGAQESGVALRARLDDESPRVRYFVANAMGRVGSSESIPDLLRLLEENADRDPIVRLGGIMGLAGSGDVAALTSAALHPSRSARLGAVVALRKLRSPAVARFLEDADVEIVTEAARAIHDLPLPDAMPALADLLPRAPIDDALLRRALNANYRLGTSRRAELIAQLTDREGIEDSLRVEAVRMLADWSATDPRDRVLGMSRPLSPRDAGEAKGALTAVFPRLLARSEDVRREALSAATKLGLGEAAPFLRSLLDDFAQSPAIRAGALGALATLGDDELETRVRLALNDTEPLVRNAARQVLATLDPTEALGSIAPVLTSDSRVERQGGFSILARLDHPEVDTLLASSLRRLLAGDFPSDTELDLLEAARHRNSGPLLQLLEQFEAGRDTEDPLAAYSETIRGGNAERGRQIFFERTEVSCVRCHKVAGVGGEVGPELTRIAQEKSREYLLEAIVAPSRTIAKNFESVVVSDVQGRIHTGIVRAEDETKLELMMADGTVVTIAQDDIEDRTVGQSAMPADVVKLLSKRDVRDLVEWLSQLR
jgi:quinoprotein glucose dehydrogenase